jgi:hypothetical protein
MTLGRPYAIAAGILGWILFAVTLWYDHRPQPPAAPATIEQLHAAGFTEAHVSTVLPPSVHHDSVEIPGAERIGYVRVTDGAKEVNTPEVRILPSNCVENAHQTPNWTLRPGDLGLRDGSLDIRKAGRSAFVRFEATLTAQTPEGEVSRTITPTAEAWISTKALGLPPRFGPTIRASTLPSIEAGVYWTKGRAQYDVTMGRDIYRREWFVAGGVRF